MRDLYQRGSRVLLRLLVPLFAATLAFAAEGAEAANEPSILWKWFNFALLAGGLGYLAAKYAPPFFRSRTAEIQKGIQAARELSQQAETRAAEMDRRMANLAAEVDRLREEAHQELSAEADRVKNETAQQIAKIQLHAEQEIASATKAARNELKAYSADLAVRLAEQKARREMGPADQDALLNSFVSDLARSAH
jgi:F-type H+-transporting ATPase subunit b